jgi:hypothetical protein
MDLEKVCSHLFGGEDMISILAVGKIVAGEVGPVNISPWMGF